MSIRLGDLCRISCGATPAAEQYAAEDATDGIFVIKLSNMGLTEPSFYSTERNFFNPKRVTARTLEEAAVNVGDVLMLGCAHKPEALGKRINVVKVLPHSRQGRPTLFSRELLRFARLSPLVNPSGLAALLMHRTTQDAMRATVLPGQHRFKAEALLEVQVDPALLANATTWDNLCGWALQARHVQAQVDELQRMLSGYPDED